MDISRRFLNLIKDSTKKGLVFYSAKVPSRKLSTVGSGSDSFLNLIVDERGAGVTNMRLVDLRGQLFNPLTPPSTIGDVQDISIDPDYVQNKLAQVAELNMEWFPLPPPIFSFHATGWVDDVFPLTGRKVLINHPSKGLIFDVDTYRAAPMPNLHRCRGEPISLFVPSADADGGSLYVMGSDLTELGGSMLSKQFQAFVYGRPTITSPYLSPYCRLLPPPPFICDPSYYPYSRITTYAAVGSNIYISAGRAGTYCLDTVSNTWGRVGQWTLPFHGKVEYIPEFKLWFGLSTEHGRLAAADLSDMNSQPQLVDTQGWEELELPNGWREAKVTRLINLGSGRFCIARFLYSLLMDGDSTAELSSILVLTGVEVTSPVHDSNSSGSCTCEVKLAIRQHKSRCHISEFATIKYVF